MWIRIDNDNIKKAALSGLFQVNLAFYKNSQTGTSVTYNIDFAQIKTHRGRKSVSFALTEDKPVNKNRKRKKNQKIPTKSSIQEDSTAQSELQDAVPSTSTSDQVLTTNPQHHESAQSLIQGDSEPLPNPNPNTTNLATLNQDTASELTTDPTNTQSTTTLTGESTMADPNAILGSQVPDNLEQPSTSTTKNDSSSDDTIIDNQNTSLEDSTQLKITSVRSLADDLPNEGSLDKSSGQVHSGMSAEEMPPLELSRRLHVNVEKYVNLLKRYQEGSVKIKPIREQDARLTNIKEKNIGFEKFQEFYKTRIIQAQNLLAILKNLSNHLVALQMLKIQTALQKLTTVKKTKNMSLMMIRSS